MFASGAIIYAYVKGNPVNFTDPTGKAIALPLICAANPQACIFIVAVGCYNVYKIIDNGVKSIIKVYNESCDGDCSSNTSDGESGDKHSSTPTGQKGSPINVKPGTNEPTTIGGRDYGGHALDQMQGRGVPPSVVEDAIQNGQPSPDPIPGRTRYYNPDNNVTVITESDGTVVTVINGKR